MRQTLFRIRLDELFSLEPIDGVTAIGVGYLLAAWLAFGLWWAYRQTRRSGIGSEHLPQIALWLGVSIALTTAPNWAASLVPAGIPVYGYGLMLFLGFMAACWNASRRAERVGLGRETVWDLGMWTFFLGIAGARLFYLVQYHERVFAGKQGLELVVAVVNLPDGGLVLYGGILTAIAAFILLCRTRKLSPLFVADIATPSFFIGLAFGRLGCFLNGCCWGDRCMLPWAVRFPEGSLPWEALVERGFLSPDAAATLALHPTQLYSSFNALVLAFLTAAYFRYRHRDGAVLAVGLLTYPITRFVLEFLRGDEFGKFDTSLTISQWVSLGVFAAGVLFTAWLMHRPPHLTRHVPKEEPSPKRREAASPA